MTAFRFPLEKVLDWRRTELELARARFEQQTAAVVALDRERAALETSAVQAEMTVRHWAAVTGGDLAALAAFRRHVRLREDKIGTARAQAQRELDTRGSAMLEARRRVRLLERLKDRRLAEWRRAFDRELEQLASDSYLAKFAADRR